MILGRIPNRSVRVVLLSSCLLLGVLIGLVLPAQGSTASSLVDVGSRPSFSEASLQALAGDLPASAHLTLWEVDEEVALPLILR